METIGHAADSAEKKMRDEKLEEAIRRGAGEIEAVAAELGVSLETTVKRIQRADLAEMMQVLRTVVRCRGNLSSAARKLKMPRSTLVRWVADYGFDVEAQKLRAAAGIKGSRPDLPGGRLDMTGERTALKDALDRNGWKADPTAKALGIGRRTLYKLINLHDLWKDRTEERRSALVAALKKAKGNQSEAGRLISIPGFRNGLVHTSVWEWCREFGIDPGEFSR